MRERLMAMLDVVLRVPPLFIMDYILIVSFGTAKRSNLAELLEPNLQAAANLTFEQADGNSSVGDPSDLHSMDRAPEQLTMVGTGTVLLHFYTFIMSMFLFVMPNRHLAQFYRFLLSLAALAASYQFNQEYLHFVSYLTDNDVLFELMAMHPPTVTKFVGNLLLQAFFSALFAYFAIRSPTAAQKRMIALVLMLPTLASLPPQLPDWLLVSSAMPSMCCAAAYACYAAVAGLHSFSHSLMADFSWCRYIVRYHGVYALLENQWTRLRVPQVLKVFWLSKTCEQIVLIGAHFVNEQYEEHGHVNWTSDILPLLVPTLRQLLITGCETIISILGMSSILCSISNRMGDLMQRFLMVVGDNDEKSIGAVSAILFFVLALQTGLTEISAEKRFIRLYQNLCLLLTANLHILHNTVNGLLFSLSASRNRSVNRHLRALSVCLFLVAFSVWMLTYLWRTHSVSTWLLAVLAFCVEMILKVILTVLIYVLFMVDAYKSSMWENLDDYVFYIKSLGNIIEFIFAILIFLNGAWILVFESGGRIRAFMMGVHAYFNIWLQAKAGINVFFKRKKAVQKLNLLRDATPDDLENFDDVCAICYQDLTSAKITNCRHFFHAVCLRKWLNIQDICPICHELMFQLDGAASTSTRNGAAASPLTDEQLAAH